MPTYKIIREEHLIIIQHNTYTVEAGSKEEALKLVEAGEAPIVLSDDKGDELDQATVLSIEEVKE